MAKFNHTGHKELWDWLAKNPDKFKEGWPGWKYNSGRYEEVACSCFACEYACEYDDMNDCDGCPLIWPDAFYCGFEVYGSAAKYSLFKRWERSTDLQKRSELAAQIRDLPVRDGVECE